MFMLLCIVAAFVGTSMGQGGGQGHGHVGALHAICHSNHLQQTEDQVIHQIVAAIDADHSNSVESAELIGFFAELMGITLGPVADLLGNMTADDLRQLAVGLTIEKQAFVHAWHQKFHDNVEFIGATFDVFDANNNGVVDVTEIEDLINTALASGDANGDGKMEESEFIVFLERIYKNC